MDKQITVNISTAAIVKVLVFAAVLAFLYLIKEVIFIIFVALIMAAALDPWVDWLQKRRIPRGLGIVIIYIILFSFVSLAVILIVPPITKEVGQLSENFPLYYEKVMNGLQSFASVQTGSAQQQVQDSLKSLGNNLPQTISSLVSTIFDIFGGIFSVLLVLVITFYLTVQEEAMKTFIQSLAPDKLQPYLMRLYGRIQLKMGLWLRGQIILSLVIFVLTFIGLTILGVPYALILAFIAGLFEIVPFIGPLLASIPAIFFAFLQSPFMGVSVIILYFVIQELENHLIVPKIMSKAVGMNALVVILVILVGAKLGGIVGALLAVPVATGLNEFLKDLIEKRIEGENKLA
ncbi:MAG: AI-2E family transporter [Candidatus Komeilibacteria bacterium]|nr:AI-2E family transporter [Candidatus Komeilibacteria bacterium]